MFVYEKDFEKLVAKYDKLLWKFVNQVNIKGMEPEDVYQELLLVLHKCNVNFDPNKKTRFITYLYHFLRNAVMSMISRSTYKSQQVYNNASLLIFSDKEDDERGIDANKIPDTHEEIDYELFEDMIAFLEKRPFGDVTIRHLVYGIPVKEIAKQDKTTTQAVYHKHHANLRALKKHFFPNLLQNDG